MRTLIYSILTIHTLLLSFSQTWKTAYDSCLIYQNNHEYQKSFEWCNKALELYEAQVMTKDTCYSNILNRQVENTFYMGQYEKSIMFAKKDSAWTKQNDYARYAGSCNNLAALYQTQGKYAQAERLYIEAQEIDVKIYGKEHPEYAISCMNLASLYKEQSKYDKAESLYKEVKEIREKVFGKAHPSYASICDNLAGLYQEQGKYEKAETLFQESKRIREQRLGKKHPSYATSCNNLSSLYQDLGRYNEAISFSNEAREVCAIIHGKNHPDYAKYTNNLALLHQLQGNYSEAERLLKEVKEINATILGKLHHEYAKSCNNLATLYQAKGEYASAELLLREAQQIQLKVVGRENPDYAAYCNNLAVLHKAQGNYDKAKSLYREALEVYTKLYDRKHIEYARTCSNLASLCQFEGKYEESERLLQEAREIVIKTAGNEHPSYAKICNNLAALYQLQSKYDEAECLFIEAKKLISKIVGSKHQQYAASCKNLGILYQVQGKYTQAEALLKEAQRICEEVLGKNHPDYALFCNHLAILYQNQGKQDEAQSLFGEVLRIKFEEIERNFKTLSENEKEQYIQANIDNYFHDFQSFVLERYKQNHAIASDSYNLILKTKGLIFQSTEKIKNRILRSEDKEIKKLYSEWKLTKDRYVNAQSLSISERKNKRLDLDSLSNRCNELEKELALKSEEFATTFTPQNITWKDIQNALKKRQAAVEIIRIDLSKNKFNPKDSVVYMALIIKKSSRVPEVVVLENGNKLENEYFIYYRRAIVNKIQDWETYNAFWKPIAQKIKEVKTVFLSPDGVYQQVNLSTLYNSATKNYVFDETQVVNVTSTRDILNRRVYTTKSSYLVGNPQFNLGIDTKNNEKPAEQQTIKGLSQLKGAENEVKQISTLLPNATTITGIDATEEYIRATKNPRVLHIATHGYFKKSKYQTSMQAMLNAGLLLAGVEDYDRMDIRPFDKEDGKLTAFEVMNMELDSTELVVLSACETGLGQAGRDGVYGLQRAFKVAGAQNIIMSLWKVNDEATQLLMTKFYENWQKNGMPKRKAFEMAQKEIRKQYKEPYYWGSFVMIE
ncbi:MAG: CHAT domain-containing protein [Bacteroidia bacterium]|nr:CHAT domain-containing protein [Bacteroidia bacterium]MDW8346883.1 CHAT domain-containing tetratricopeptide repeat protein [Bacteroidia bacterium]